MKAPLSLLSLAMSMAMLCLSVPEVSAQVVIYGGVTAQITNSLPGRSIIKLLPDYAQPVVLALNQGDGSTPGTVLELNPTNGAILGEIAVDLNPTDMALTPAGDTLYVINAGSRTISQVSMSTFTVVADQSISTPSAYNTSNPLYVVAGPPGTVYFTDGAWGPEIYEFDYAARTATLVLDTGGNEGFGAGGMVLSRSDNTLYIWQQYGWSAGYANSDIASFAVGANSLTQLATGPSQGRDPLDTPIFLDGAQRWVFNKAQKVSATNVTVLLTQFTDNIYAISLDGSVAFGPTEVFNAQTGFLIAQLSFATEVEALSGDQQELLRFNASDSSIYVYNMASIAPVSGPAIVPTPADGSVTASEPTNLVWSPSPTALAYNVYFGTNAAAVAAATVSSPLYLGQVFMPGISLGPLVPGDTYYWRVDTIGINAVNAGSIWSFTVSPVTITPASVSVGAITGYNPAATSLTVTTNASTDGNIQVTGMAWSAQVTGAAWLTLSATNGTAPATLGLAFNTAALAAGIYTNNVEFTIGTERVAVPVTVTINELNIVKMCADLQRPYIYALQPPALSGQSGQLLFINTLTGNIDQTLPIGINPVDLTINYAEGRLYIASWGENATYVVDLNRQTLLPPLLLGTDVFKINAGKPGRIVTEGEDQWIGVNIVDTTTGAVVGSLPYPERAGDGKMDPTGTYYYHCDSDISDAYIHKDQIVNDVATEVAGSIQHPYGSRNLVMSADGTALFWQGFIFDASLNQLGSLGEEIYATTAHGDLALGGQHVFNTHNGQMLYAWPFAASVMAVSGDQQNVFLFNSTSGQLTIIPMSSIATVPGPGLNPNPANGAVVNPPLAQLAWTVSPFAWSYQVYCGTNAAAVAAAATNSPLYLGVTTTNAFALAAPLNLGATYYWRVDSAGYSGVTAGPVWSFTTFGLAVSPQTLSLSGVTGLPVLPQTIFLTAPLPAGWSLATAQPWLCASPGSGVTPAAVTLKFNTTNLTAGLYTNQLILSANGLTLRVPVTLQLFDLNASQIVADPNRDYIYVLHPGSGNAKDAFLLCLNTDSGIVEKVIPIGINPTDMTVNRFEDRLYVSNWQFNETHVVDLRTQTEIAPLALGTDVYKINAGRSGRIIIEGEDQWVSASLINTTSGSTINSIGVREGDGQFDPTGRYYYHVDDNDSAAAITKFDMFGDVFTSVASDSLGNFGSRNLVMSLDGSRLFWTGESFDANLTDLGPLGSEIYASSTNGAIAFSSQQVIDTTTGQVIYNLPVNTTVEGVDRRNQRLWYFNAGTSRIENIPLSTIFQPAITQQPAPVTTVGVGANVYLTVAAIGESPLSYQWTLAGGNLPGQTNFFLALNNIQTVQRGNYQVVVSNPYGAVTSMVAQVKVLIPPTVVQQPKNITVAAGQKFTLCVGAAGSAPFSFQWLYQGNVIGNATNSMFTVADAQAVDDGVYSVMVVNQAGSINSSLARVRVLPAKPAIVSNPVSVTEPAGTNVIFKVTATGSEPLSYQWFFNNQPVRGANAAQLTLYNVQAGNAGSYKVSVANGSGAATSAAAALQVRAVVPYFELQPVTTAILSGTTVTLTSQAAGTQPIRYQWYFNGVMMRNQTNVWLTIANATPKAAGNYTVIAINVRGATKSMPAQVTVEVPPLTVTPLASQIVQAGRNVSLKFSANGTSPLSYAWQFNGILLPDTNAILTISNVAADLTGYYQVTASNPYGSTSSVARVSVVAPASQLLAWGDNSGGQTNVPAGMTDIVGASGGDFHTVAIHANGTLAAWGDNDEGQISIPKRLQPIAFVASGASHNLALDLNGSIIAWGNNISGQCDIPAAATNQPLTVAAGDAHSLALLANGMVVAWGDNTYGQTNLPDVLTPGYYEYEYWTGQYTWVTNLNWLPAADIAAGRNHNLAVLATGSVVGWGDNSFGQTDVPSSLTNAVMVAGGYLHSAALCEDGTVVAWGDDTYGQTDVPAGLTNVVAIAAGDFDTLALLANGTVVGWGDNLYGQIDIPVRAQNAVDIAAGYYHSLALVPPLPPLPAHPKVSPVGR